MTPDRFRQIEELYHAARQRTPEQRAALLSQTDPELRRELESLLAQHAGDEFLDRPAIQNAPQLLEDSTLTDLAGHDQDPAYRAADLGNYRRGIEGVVRDRPGEPKRVFQRGWLNGDDLNMLHLVRRNVEEFRGRGFGGVGGLWSLFGRGSCGREWPNRLPGQLFGWHHHPEVCRAAK